MPCCAESQAAQQTVQLTRPICVCVFFSGSENSAQKSIRDTRQVMVKQFLTMRLRLRICLGKVQCCGAAYCIAWGVQGRETGEDRAGVEGCDDLGIHALITYHNVFDQ